MAFHRTVDVTDPCCVCGVVALRDVQFYVGIADCGTMNIGELLVWNGSPYVERGGRPATPTGTASGVGECCRCGSIIDYDIVVDDSVIVEVRALGPFRGEWPVRPPWVGSKSG